LSRDAGQASRPPPVLQRIRVARRDCAAAEQRRLQDCSAAALAAVALARADLRSACTLREDMHSGRGPAAAGGLRLAALPSCDALVARAQDTLALAQGQAEQAQTALHLQRQALQACERALMRSEAWAQQEQQGQREQEQRLEQDLDDELAARFRSPSPSLDTGLGSASTSA
jgi:hypothetical protein